MRFTVSANDIFVEMDQTEQALAQAVTAAMQDAHDDLLAELKAQVVAAGLGTRLSRTWRGKVYPSVGASLEPAAYISSRAPKIVESFSNGSLIRAQGGRYLALPTPNTPLGRGGRRMTPAGVLAKFGRRNFTLVTPKANTRIRLLVLNGLTTGRSGKLRSPTAREAKRGLAKDRRSDGVVMFVLIAQARMPKRLDLEGVADRVAATMPSLFERHWSR